MGAAELFGWWCCLCWPTRTLLGAVATNQTLCQLCAGLHVCDGKGECLQKMKLLLLHQIQTKICIYRTCGTWVIHGSTLSADHCGPHRPYWCCTTQLTGATHCNAGPILLFPQYLFLYCGFTVGGYYRHRLVILPHWNSKVLGLHWLYCLAVTPILHSLLDRRFQLTGKAFLVDPHCSTPIKTGPLKIKKIDTCEEVVEKDMPATIQIRCCEVLDYLSSQSFLCAVSLFASVHLEVSYVSVRSVSQCPHLYPPPQWFLGHVLLL